MMKSASNLIEIKFNLNYSLQKFMAQLFPYCQKIYSREHGLELKYFANLDPDVCADY